MSVCPTWSDRQRSSLRGIGMDERPVVCKDQTVARRVSLTCPSSHPLGRSRTSYLLHANPRQTTRSLLHRIPYSDIWTGRTCRLAKVPPLQRSVFSISDFDSWLRVFDRPWCWVLGLL